jgi:class 3 adenylate cyclase
VLATVLSIKFADGFYDSFEATNWQDTVARSGELIRREIMLFRGREIPCGETGLLAMFDGPARAIRCAIAITDSVQRLNIPVKTGLHTGECDVEDGRYGGFTVELAQKIADQAAEQSIWVSRTVKDLVAGSGLVFDELGKRSFPDTDRKWRLFAVQR